MQASRQTPDLKSIQDNVTFLDTDFHIIWTNSAGRTCVEPGTSPAVGSVCHRSADDRVDFHFLE